jgi:hypothetical protein
MTRTTRILLGLMLVTQTLGIPGVGLETRGANPSPELGAALGTAYSVLGLLTLVALGASWKWPRLAGWCAGPGGTRRYSAGIWARSASEYGCADISLPDSARTSAKKRPVVAPGLMDLVRKTYFAGADLSDALASPSRHPDPPHSLTLILTAEYDTVRHEMNALGDDLAAKGVDVTGVSS